LAVKAPRPEDTVIKAGGMARDVAMPAGLREWPRELGFAFYKVLRIAYPEYHSAVDTPPGTVSGEISSSGDAARPERKESRESKS
jgi:hypothetical protein